MAPIETQHALKAQCFGELARRKLLDPDFEAE